MTMPTLPGNPQAGAAALDPAIDRLPGPGSQGPGPRNRAAGKARGGLGSVARQFAGPSGPAGRLVTWLLARGNAPLNRWLVREVAAAVPAPATVIELGCGPGIALAELLSAYPAARVIGADPSAVVLTSARRRNRRAVADGRLTLVTGDIATAARYAPAGLVLACHVLYFWPDPVGELQRIRQILAPAGHLALGYQLRHHMPPVAQHTFPREGFTLYDSDDQIATVLEQAGFTRPEVRIFGAPDRPMGRLALSTPAPRQATADTADTAGRAQED
jgi:SAM-dependent methyltransferase